MDKEIAKNKIKNKLDEPNIQQNKLNLQHITHYKSTNIQQLSPEISSQDQPNHLQTNPYYNSNFTTHKLYQNFTQNHKQKNLSTSFQQITKIKKPQRTLYQPITQHNDKLNFNQRNSNGSQLTEQFKRNFVKKLLNDIKGQSSKFICTMVQRQADRIRVFPNQVSCWLAMYKIVFKIQQQISNRKYNTNELLQLFQQHLLAYLNQNIHIKKYKFLRIACGITKSLRIKKCTGSYWLQQFIYKYKNDLDPRISILGDIKGLNIDTNKYQNNQIKITKRKRRRKKIQILGDCLPSVQRQFELNNFINQKNDEGDKNKIICQIDGLIDIQILRIIKMKANQYSLKVQDLKQWYNDYGKYNQFLRKKQIDIENMKVCQIAQKQLIKRIKKNDLETKKEIAKQAYEIVNNLKIKQLKQFSILQRWLQIFLNKNCAIINQKVKLKAQNQNPQYKRKVPSLFNLNISIKNKYNNEQA